MAFYQTPEQSIDHAGRRDMTWYKDAIINIKHTGSEGRQRYLTKFVTDSSDINIANLQWTIQSVKQNI